MKKVAAFLLLSLAFAAPLMADDAVSNVWQSANSEVYGTKLGGMLGRGVLNVVTCFVDIIVHTVEGSKEGPPVVGTLTGLGSGLGCTALRLTSGALDVVTFWVPDFNGFPVSRSYSNCLEFEEGELPVKTEEAGASAPLAPPAYEEPAPSKAEEYVKPAAPVHHDPMDYVKK